jgi:hypothetical protein
MKSPPQVFADARGGFPGRFSLTVMKAQYWLQNTLIPGIAQ